MQLVLYAFAWLILFSIDILCPLKQASELPDHPTLSQPYRSKALPTMINAIDDKLRRERALLARAHNLHRMFLGDSDWMPCGTVESKEDPFIFRPRHVEASHQQHRINGSQTENDRVENVENGDITQMETVSNNQDENNAGDDVEMTEAPVSDADKIADTEELKKEDGLPSLKDVSRHSEGGEADSTAREKKSSENGKIDSKEPGPNTTQSSPQAPDAEGGDTVMQDASESRSLENDEDTSSPEPPRRMTTRAQANASTSNENGATTSGSSRYPSPDAATQLSTAHPMFLVSDNIRPDKDFGLPSNEAEDTRRLLWSYIQKQEETVRNFTYMLNSLLQADHLKEDVFEWCKAEGHIGEMSDGEDWYDREKWGLGEGEDLKKGADDDEVETAVVEERTTGKRGRRRQ
jgi:hypothetical protein